MRRGLAKILNLVASVNRMAIFDEEDGMRHGGIVHSSLYQISFIEVAVKVPDGVEYPALPVETGQL
jgi:hypothetical protein